MYIKKIKIKNYKKIQDESYEFGPINVIIGKNNAGKTTLLEVLNLYMEQNSKPFKGFVDLEIDVETSKFSSKLVPTGNTGAYKWVHIDIDNQETTFSDDGGSSLLPANPKMEDIENSIKDGIIASMSEEVRQDVERIKQSLGLYEIVAGNSTDVITEEGDNFDAEKKFDIKKAISVKFDSDDPLNIANKGLGQQKEFILNHLVDLYDQDGELYCFKLFVDEIENSLSIDSVKGILNQMADVNNVDEGNVHEGEDPYPLQVFYTTHNPDTIIKDINPNVISVGEPPSAMFRELVSVIFCEGHTDAQVFRDVFPTKTFIPLGGGNLTNGVRAIITQNTIAKVIVDGDRAGISYVTSLSPIAGVDIRSLAKGTIEDYQGTLAQKNSIVNAIMATVGTDYLTPGESSINILQSFGTKMSADGIAPEILKGNKSVLKNRLQILPQDNSLFLELEVWVG